MSKFKEMIGDWKTIKACLYVVLTASLLYIIYLLVGNLPTVLSTVSSVLGSLFGAITPLLIGGILAYLLAPLVNIIDTKVMTKVFFKLPDDPLKLEKRLGTRRTFSILLTFVMIIVAVCALIYAFTVLIVGQLVFGSLAGMIQSIIDYFQQYEETIMSWAKALPANGLDIKVQEILDLVLGWFSSNFSTAAVINFITGLGGGVLNVILGAVVSVYLIKDQEYFKRLWRKLLHLLLPQKANAMVTETLNDVNGVVSLFIRGQLLDALIIAVVSSVGLSLINLEFAVFIGCFAGLANVIPYFGPIIGMIPAAIIGLFTGGPVQALLAVVVLLVIQQIDGNIIYPKIVGSSMGLHPVFVLVAVTVGGYYGGIVGMIIAVPITAILKVFMIRKIDKIETKETASL
ncbi:MAG: AI-2E family transporter [Anaerovorax sp.]